MPEQTRNLVRMLRTQTEAGRRSWDKGSVDTELIFVHDAGSVIISSIDGDGQYPYELRILDTAGRVVERYDTNDDEGTEEFRDLFEVARRSSIKPSAVVETLVEQLGDEGDIPF